MKNIAYSFKKFLFFAKKIKNWPVYFLDRFGFIKNKLIVYHFANGQKIKLRSGTMDRVPIDEIFIYNSYNPTGFEIKKQDVVVDIGAHIGIFSIFASNYAMKVYSFEPVAENFKLLEENIKLNEIKNIRPFKAAISNEIGQKEIFYYDNNTGGHSFYVPYKNSSNKLMVDTFTLEYFITTNNIQTIDFLKIDCEGGEYDILFNSPTKILNIIKKISMEYHNIDTEKNVSTLKKFLEKNSFTVDTKPSNHRLGCLFAKK